MKITVVGAGAVGGYFGGRMAEHGLDVTFLVREKRAEQLRETGLVIESPFGNLQLEPKLATAPEEIDHADLVLLAVKNYHLEATIESIRPLMEKGAKVLPLLNGVAHFERLQQEFGKDAVLGGLCHIIATLDEKGRIVHTNQLHLLTFGPLQASQAEFCRQFAAAASDANLTLKLSDNAWVDVWNKYIFITAFSGVTTASRLTIDQVLASEPTALVYERALAEMTALAHAYNAPQPDNLVEFLFNNTRKQPAGATSSMHQDFRKGLALEVESLQGAAVQLGAKAGVPMPTVATLYGLIKPFEEKGHLSHPQ